MRACMSLSVWCMVQPVQACPSVGRTASSLVRRKAVPTPAHHKTVLLGKGAETRELLQTFVERVEKDRRCLLEGKRLDGKRARFTVVRCLLTADMKFLIYACARLDATSPGAWCPRCNATKVRDVGSVHCCLCPHTRLLTSGPPFLFTLVTFFPAAPVSFHLCPL